MHRRTRLAAWVILAAALAWWPAGARAAPRPRFEPTDLEWEDTGVAEFDLPVAPGAHGVGVEALAVMGGAIRRLTCVLNMGGFYDPAPDAVSHRPGGLELGLDLQFKLDDIDRFSLKGEISGTTFVTSDPNQAQVTLGFAWNVLPMLELSLTGLLGTPSGGDKYGLLFGISPKFRFFK